MAETKCETIQVRDTEGRLIQVECASTCLEIVQAWEAQFPGVPLTVSVESNMEGPVLHFGIVGGPADV